MKSKILIMGAAGRDFHNFNVLYREDTESEVVAFTAAQIPFISERRYPPELSGPLYPHGIPIYPESELERLITDNSIDTVVFSYSDVSYDYVMERAAICNSLGADFVLPGPSHTMITAGVPVVSVTAVRTGCGKSGVTRFVARGALDAGIRTAAVRHPMPYGDLASQAVQRFVTTEELAEADCTIEEREEYEPLINMGVTVFTGVDYAKILAMAESESQLVIWDGGNNDLPFFEPTLDIVVTDPLRAGDERRYYPGEANLRRADCAVINKVNSASGEQLKLLRKNITELNPGAAVVETESIVTTKDEEKARNRRVLVIEDGPTLTHGGMKYGAGIVAARSLDATPIDPRPFARGSIKDTLEKYPAIKELIPAMGYSINQRKDLEETINASDADAVIVATPIKLDEIIDIKKPIVNVSYEVRDKTEPGLRGVLDGFFKHFKD